MKTPDTTRKLKQTRQATVPASLLRQRSMERRGSACLLFIPAFALLYLLVTLYGQVPRALALVYVLMSLLCFATYAWDKSAARSGRWRTRESTLLMLGLLCGWPGALLAQQVLRHKSAKASFQTAFWVTVLLSVAGFLGVCARL